MLTRDELLSAWDAFSDTVRRRILAGHDHYGNQWQRRGVDGNLVEADMEMADWFAYMFFAQECARREAKEAING